MTEVISALIPPLLVGAAVVYGVLKLLRSDAAGLRRRREPGEEPSEKTLP
ncbi:hypothetical protein Aph01nite_20290 [Acrocarpospora phusangensis]|uniref:Uncharacterized protein n=1 Tax=Acrocarpospora phusangensis TaxID=1070424 RepID=A0A919UJ45_9ACTN|nr:hypothetical protein Aph01nite_20290 [Acrocarpospora phusangensis]